MSAAFCGLKAFLPESTWSPCWMSLKTVCGPLPDFHSCWHASHSGVCNAKIAEEVRYVREEAPEEFTVGIKAADSDGVRPHIVPASNSAVSLTGEKQYNR